MYIPYRIFWMETLSMISVIQFRNVATSAMRAVKHSNHKFARRVWLEGCWYHNVFPFLKLESGKHFSVVDVGPRCSHLPVFVEERRLKSTWQLRMVTVGCRGSVDTKADLLKFGLSVVLTTLVLLSKAQYDLKNMQSSSSTRVETVFFI